MYLYLSEIQIGCIAWWGFLWQPVIDRRANVETLTLFLQRWSLMVKGRYGVMKLEYKWCLWRWRWWWWWWWSWSLDISDVGRAISGQEGVLKGASPTPIVLPIEQYALRIWHIVAYCTYGILSMLHIPQCCLSNMPYCINACEVLHIAYICRTHILTYPNLSPILIYQKPEMCICA